MNEEQKKARLLELITEIQEMYSDMDGIMVTDQMIMIANQDLLVHMGEELGLSIVFDDEAVMEEFEEDEIMGLLDWGGEDSGNNGDGGPLQ